MKSILMVSVLAVSMIGCTQYKKLTGHEDREVSSTGPHLIAASGALPGSNTLTFSPAFDSSESMQAVRVRVSGVLVDVSDAVSGGVYYSFDGATLTIHNYVAAGNQGNNPDNFAVYYMSPYPAGFHSVS